MKGIAGSAELWQAAEIIRDRGHCKGQLYDADGRVCMVGALIQATNKTTQPQDMRLWEDAFAVIEPYLLAVVAEQFPDRTTLRCCTAPYVAFNNHLDTTPEEVISVLEKAAVQLEEKIDV